MIATIRKYRWTILLLSLLSLIGSSAYAFYVGVTFNIFYVGSTKNLYSVGNNSPIIPATQGSNLLLVLFPMEVALIAAIILVFRMRNTENMASAKAVILTGMMAIFLVIMFLIIYNFLNVFR